MDCLLRGSAEIILYGTGAGFVHFVKYYGVENAATNFLCYDRRGGDNKFGIKYIDLYQEPIDSERIIIITILDPRIVIEIGTQLSKKGYNRIYRYIARDDSISGIKDRVVSLEGLRDDWIPRVEMHAFDGCNLNCKYCSHFSPLYRGEQPNYEKNMAGCQLLGNIVDCIVEFNLLGGEPLLNDEICKWIEGVRKRIKILTFYIITNGLLIPTLKKETINCIRENNVIFSISQYEPTIRQIDKIKEFLDEHELMYRFSKFEKKAFLKCLSDRHDTNNGKICLSKDCVNIREGLISRCPTVMYVSRLNSYFDKDFPTDGIYRIEDFANPGDLCAAMNKRISLCDYCIFEETEWDTCSKNIRVEDFLG